jgi:tetratricopeptide (TPR) repeat protein
MFPFYASELGYAYALLGRIREAIALAEQAVERAVAMKVTSLQSHLIIRLSMVYRLAGRVDEASRRAREALAFARKYQERGYEAQALWLLDDIATHHNPSDVNQAQTYYQQALTLANELGMRPLQAHCHRGLGTLYSQAGQTEQARTELTTAIEMYREMEMTFWLPETEAVLAEVEKR